LRDILQTVECEELTESGQFTVCITDSSGKNLQCEVPTDS